MIRRLIILLLILGYGYAHNLSPQFDIDNMSETDKKVLYDKNKKNPLLAGLLSISLSTGTGLMIPSLSMESSGEFSLSGIPALGHAYTANWRRGVFIGASTSAYSMVGLFSTPLGNTILISGFLLQCQDAIYLTNKYNDDLHQNIYNKETLKKYKKSIIQKLIEIKLPKQK